MARRCSWSTRNTEAPTSEARRIQPGDTISRVNADLFNGLQFAARSPITYVANVTTPLMLVNGDADYRTPPADGGEMMFRALKYRKIPTVMVRFPRETHELSRSGEPWHRVERLQHIVGWMDQWLLGKKNVAYATQ